jgi:hypothetical protein
MPAPTEAMGETIPEDVLAIGESIARDLPYRVGPKSREFAAAVIARAILAERMAERERCAKIADELFYPDETKISARIRDAIRKPTP